MKTAFVLFLFCCGSVHAASKAIFVSTGGEVRIFVQSSTAADTDAARFSEMMSAPERLDGSNLKKSSTFTSSDGVPVDFLCSTSSRIKNFGSCQIVLKASKNVKIDRSNPFIDYQITEANEIADFLKHFKFPAIANPVFISSDGRFTFEIFSSAGRVDRISMQYQE